MLRFFKLMIVTVQFALLTSCATLPEFSDLRTPRYQTGENKGAAYCASCHPDTHEQWSTRSRHAQSTKSATFQNALLEIKENIVVGNIIDEEMCYACHGNKKRNAGIDCESCHGTVLPGVPIETTHEKKYTPNLVEMRKSDFCARCHQTKMPFTGEALTTLHDEWKQSPAAKKGLTCQGCHMAKGEDDNYAYHGFKTAVRNGSLYKNKLKISQIAINHKRLRLLLENRVQGHSIPASGPTRILAAEIQLLNEKGVVIHRDVRRFFKHFSMLPLVGGVPFMLINNTQLRSGEKRRIRFDFPDGTYKRSAKLTLVLLMYEVADKYEGDITRAHWVSKPIIQKTVRISNRK
ncbi:MAG: hypothetical protein GY927_07585 [bacterium]|nr:hypothetical protein [bacterium]